MGRVGRLPYDFKYAFTCADAACGGHELKCTDWEMGEAWRRWRDRYGAGWETKFREKFDTWMRSRDLQFFVGTLHEHQKEWIIVGLFYPPRPKPPRSSTTLPLFGQNQ